jgi:hypothetical protein
VPFQTLTKIYRSLIYPYLSYGSTVWGNATQKQLKKLLILQKRVLRLVHFAKNRDHAIPLFNNTNNFPISMLYVESVSKLMYDVTIELIPENISDLFIQTSNVHSYITRSSTAGNYYKKYCHTNQQKNAFSRIGAKVWNNVPLYIRNL